MIKIGIEEAKIIIRIIDYAHSEFQAGEKANLINSRLKEHVKEYETSDKEALNIANVVGQSEQLCKHNMVVNRETMDSMICSKGCGHEIK